MVLTLGMKKVGRTFTKEKRIILFHPHTPLFPIANVTTKNRIKLKTV